MNMIDFSKSYQSIEKSYNVAPFILFYMIFIYEKENAVCFVTVLYITHGKCLVNMINFIDPIKNKPNI